MAIDSLDAYIATFIPFWDYEMYFSVGTKRVQIRFCAMDSASYLRLCRDDANTNSEPIAFVGAANRVRLMVCTLLPKKRQKSARFSAEEWVAILGNQWPSEENLGNIERSINDRKAYPMPGYVPPPERSPAQGQTKKPGSHSDRKHNRR